MRKRILVNVFLIICLGVFQIAFIRSLPPPFNHINIALAILIFILVLNSHKLAVWWSVSLGILFDFYSFLPFGINLIGLLAAVLANNFLLVNFFTNRSLYSLLFLTFSASIIFNLLMIMFSYFVDIASGNGYFIPLSLDSVADFFVGIMLNLVLVVVIFYLLSVISSRYKPVFLKTK